MFCKILKLNNGETIIGDIVEERNHYVEVFRPIKIMYSIRGNGNLHISLLRWDPAVNTTLPIRFFKQNIISVAEPDSDFKESYIQAYEAYDISYENSKEENIQDDLPGTIDEIIDKIKELSNTTNKTIH